MERDQLAHIIDVEVARHYFDDTGHTPIRFKSSIEKKSFEHVLICGGCDRRRDSIDDCLEHGLDPCAYLGRNIQNFLQFEIELLQQLIFGGTNVCGLSVYLVDYRDDHQVCLKCFVEI